MPWELFHSNYPKKYSRPAVVVLTRCTFLGRHTSVALLFMESRTATGVTRSQRGSWNQSDRFDVDLDTPVLH